MTDGYLYLHREGAKPLKLWSKGVTIEEMAMQQLKNISELPFVYKHVAAMPDCHWGNGTSVGTVIATQGAVIPAAVGVDIGCGMAAVKLNRTASQLPDNLRAVRDAIEAVVPVGFKSHDEPPRDVDDRWYAHGSDDSLKERYRKIQEKHPKLATRKSPAKQIGTLGGGNHFIELCFDTGGDVWLMLHSGSRNVGKTIGDYFTTRAKDVAKQMFITLPDVNLSYLVEGTDDFNDYINAVLFAQDYAAHNRHAMVTAILKALRPHLGDDLAAVETVVNCHHNYVEREHHFGQNVWLTRKGAVRARKNDLGIIPGSMGARSYIVRGKGNPESFCSCSHGAGRAMSRGDARRKFTVEDHITATQGVECRKDEGVIDETPMAYKDIDAVMAAQTDLVEVVATLKQVLCVKG